MFLAIFRSYLEIVRNVLQRAPQPRRFFLLLAQSRRQSKQRHINPIKEIFLVSVLVSRWGSYGIHQPVKRVTRSGGYRDSTQPLRFLMFESLDRKLHIRHPQHRIHFAGIQLDRVVLIWTALRSERTDIADVELLRLPRQQPFLDLLRKPIGVCCRPKRLLSQNCGSLMMPMPIAFRSREPRHQHIGPKLANHPHYVGERDIVPLPLLKCLFGTLRITKVRHLRESLLDSVIAVGREHFQRAQHS